MILRIGIITNEFEQFRIQIQSSQLTGLLRIQLHVFKVVQRVQVAPQLLVDL